jgi:hypothetical protein
VTLRDAIQIVGVRLDWEDPAAIDAMVAGVMEGRR